MVAVGAFGQTALDWNRVPTRSQSEATQYYDATAPKGSIMLLTGSLLSFLAISSDWQLSVQGGILILVLATRLLGRRRA